MNGNTSNGLGTSVESFADHGGLAVAFRAYKRSLEGRPSRVIDGHQGWVRAVAVSPDGATVASCGNDGLVKLWSATDGSPTATFKGHDCHVYNLAFHPGGKSLVSADLKGVVKEWDLAKGTVAREFDAKALYKYDPHTAARYFSRFDYKPGFHWLAQSEFTVLSTSLKDPATGIAPPTVCPVIQFRLL